MTRSARVILQSEAAECGLACLAMVASVHGHGIDLPTLRRRFPLSLKGARLNLLIEIAAQLGMRGRPLRLELSDLGQLQRPCLLHWDLNHFVVLHKVSRKSVIILDPAYGERSMPLVEVSRHFTGVALELSLQPDFIRQAAPAPLRIRELTGPLEGLGRALSQILALSIVLQCLVALAPFLMQWVVDQVLVSADHDLLQVLALGFGLSLLLQVSISWLRGQAILHTTSQLGLQWLGNVVAHLLRLPLAYFESRHVGDISSRLGSLQTIQKMLATGVVETVIDGLMAIIMLALMFVYSQALAIVTLLVVCVYLGIRLAVFPIIRSRTEQQLLAVARQQGHLLESLRGIQSLKVTSQEPQRRTAYDRLLADTIDQDLILGRIQLRVGTINQLLFGAERIIVIWLGAQLALASQFSVGMLIAYLAYKDQFTLRVAGLIDKAMEFRMLGLHAQRLADVVQTEPEQEVAHDAAFETCAAKIEVADLSFRYGEGEPWVLNRCSFSVREGESVAIVGSSGCGKTTLLKILLGLQPPSLGTIKFGGRDLRQVGARNLRRLVGVVMQDDQLFAGCIADNISFFDPDAHPERVATAARLAAVHDEIVAMPMGYSSLIGDMGSALSGGQKQRILLARALYRLPRFLFLDEATSHLDLARERLVNDAVRSLKLTRVIIAHRPETIASADRVLIMEAGRVSEREPQRRST